MTLCSLVEISDIFEEHTASILTYLILFFDPEDRGSTFLRNVGVLLSDYTASLPHLSIILT
jgi:hypothetical protein